MSNAQVVFFSFTWLISNFVVLGFLAKEGILGDVPEIQFPEDFAQDPNQQGTEDNTGLRSDSWTTRYSSCTSDTVFGLVANVITVGTFCVVAATEAPLLYGKIHIPFISDLLKAIRIAVATIVFLFQMVNWSVNELPAPINFILYGPPGIALIYIAIAIMRGVG